MDTGEAASKKRFISEELCLLSAGLRGRGVEMGRDEGNSLQTTDESRARFVGV